MPILGNFNPISGWRMKATISVDHRVSDGAEAAQFMQALAGFLEKSCKDVGIRIGFHLHIIRVGDILPPVMMNSIFPPRYFRQMT